MMENPIKKLREVLDKREKLEEEGKKGKQASNITLL